MSVLCHLSVFVAIPFETAVTFAQIFGVALKDYERAEEMLQAIRDYTTMLMLKIRKPFWED